MRDIKQQAVQASSLGLRSASLKYEQQRLERAVRARALRTLGKPLGPGHHPERHRGLRRDRAAGRAFGDNRLLEIIDIEGELHVLVCGSGKVRRFPAGSAEHATREVRFARFMLRRLAYGPSVPPIGEACDRLNRMGGLLEQVLLGSASEHLGTGEVIVVPPRPPAGRAVGAAAAAALPGTERGSVGGASWLRARRARAGVRAAEADVGDPDAARPVVLVRGPGLASRGAEIPHLAADYSDALVLGDGTATASRVLSAIDGARVVHIAAHGTFRADGPVFRAAARRRAADRLRPGAAAAGTASSGLVELRLGRRRARRRQRCARAGQLARSRWARPGSWPASSR